MNKNEVQTLKQEAENHLVNELMPFWTTRMIDNTGSPINMFIVLFSIKWSTKALGSGIRCFQGKVNQSWTHMGHSWKINYHTVMAMIQSIRRLDVIGEKLK